MVQQQFSPHAGSYRDPAGFIFTHNNEVYRQVNLIYQKDFEQLMNSGLYEKLSAAKLLIKHQVIDQNLTGDSQWYTTLKPEQLRFVSYPYEWSFDMLKDAALLTLQLTQKAIEHGMILKDATPYNIQFHAGDLIFIDSLSFECYDESKPWVAYRQFCESFLAPLALMHYHQEPLQPLILSYPEGIPLAVASKLLPARSKINLNLYLHLHFQASFSQKPNLETRKAPHFSRQKLQNLLKSLEHLISSFKLKSKTTWAGYYEEAGSRDSYLTTKKQIIQQWLDDLKGINTAIDIGGNEGLFSELSSSRKIFTITADADHSAINSLYKKMRQTGKHIHPLLQDLSNPSPAIGVNHSERSGFLQRGKCDLAIALALIHHLAIGKSIPFKEIALLFRTLGKHLIIEFVPREDEKVRLMLSQKTRPYQEYSMEEFRSVFSKYFSIKKQIQIASSNRTLFLMEAYENDKC